MPLGARNAVFHVSLIGRKVEDLALALPIFIGSTIGGFIPELWGGEMLSYSGVLLSGAGRRRFRHVIGCSSADLTTGEAGSRAKPPAYVAAPVLFQIRTERFILGVLGTLTFGDPISERQATDRSTFCPMSGERSQAVSDAPHWGRLLGIRGRRNVRSIGARTALRPGWRIRRPDLPTPSGGHGSNSNS
jgi:hypothetical protein